MDKAEADALLDAYLANSPNVQKAAQAALEAERAARAERKAQEKRDAEAAFVIHQAANLPPPEPQKPAKKQYRLRPFAEVAYEAPRFLFNPYILQNAITIIQGDSGVGKTALICKLAAAVSIGGVMQDVQCEEGNVLICSVEDDPPTLRGRIEASGGDLTRCFFPENAHELSFMDDALDDLIEEIHAKMIVFDPLQAFLGAKVDMHRANETRPVMARLAGSPSGTTAP
jgi:Mrp family chromosome partitioning ATPase